MMAASSVLVFTFCVVCMADSLAVNDYLQKCSGKATQRALFRDMAILEVTPTSDLLDSLYYLPWYGQLHKANGERQFQVLQVFPNRINPRFADLVARYPSSKAKSDTAFGYMKKGKKSAYLMLGGLLAMPIGMVMGMHSGDRPYLNVAGIGLTLAGVGSIGYGFVNILYTQNMAEIYVKRAIFIHNGECIVSRSRKP